MTQMEALEEMKQVFTTQKNELEEARSEIYTRKEQAMSDALFPYFEGFNPDVYIEVTRGSIYFKMDHSELSYRKELFTLYLRERYFEEGQRYDGVDLSYYTTSTKGDDEWELKRLRILGDAAEVVLKRQHDIVDTANYTSNLFKDEFKRSYDQMNLINKGIRELDDKKRNDLFAKCDQMIVDQAPVLPILTDDFMVMINARVRDFQTNSMENLDFSTKS
jgi:hypothetical protein